MGAMSPHTRAIQFSSLLGDTTKQLDIQLILGLNDEELNAAAESNGRLALLHVRNTLAVPSTQDDLSLVQYLSSPQGQKLVAQAQTEINEELDRLRQTKVLEIHLIMDPSRQQIRGTNLFSQEVLKLLDEMLPPALASISYFPADRAMPMGETNIQIGSADSQHQLQSHLSHPNLKYNRLKQFIINQTLLSPRDKTNIQTDFALIFDSLLVGKTLKEFRISEHGLLSVRIEEQATGKSFDIDQMSSGEKGLILQFLLMRRAIRKGGIALIDEPELHLNPAVCKQLLPFVMSNVCQFNEIQALICTHSPEILADAFEDQKCQLLHLRSGSDLSSVFPHDKTELFEALRRLGATTGDVLFSRGSLFVEGPHDAEILEAAFPTRVSGYKITPLRGRTEVEKEIRTLQSAEAEHKLNNKQLFIFDRDSVPTGLVSSDLVRLLQWDRYCFENYLLDSDVIYDVCKDARSANPPESRGSLRQLMKETAFSQLNNNAARFTYSFLEPKNAGFRPKEIEPCNSFREMATVLVARLLDIRTEVSDIQEEEWKQRFVDACEVKYEELKAIWEEKWQSECDGKKVLSYLHSNFKMNISALEFKRRIALIMATQASENWRVVDSFLANLI
jgi:hypothetical protein